MNKRLSRSQDQSGGFGENINPYTWRGFDHISKNIQSVIQSVQRDYAILTVLAMSNVAVTRKFILLAIERMLCRGTVAGPAVLVCHVLTPAAE
jgi:hypothetical protein